jgi:inorganic pyrophosphatase
MEIISEPAVPIFIEIPKGSNQKYEYCKQQGKLVLDRVLPEPFVYPYSYGFIPNTLADDGDELDALVLCDEPIPSDTRLAAHIIGALLMEDEKGIDHKILAVLDSDYESGAIRDISDIPAFQLESIQSFFSNYKFGEPEKWSSVKGFVSKKGARQIYKSSLTPVLMN